MIPMFIRYQSMARTRLATLILATVGLGLSAARPVQAEPVQNCNEEGATTPCFEKVWVDGAQVKMTFLDLNPTPANPSDVNFYVLAVLTNTPQGGPVPFFHDHVTDENRSLTEGRRAHSVDHPVHYHGFLVFCSEQGITSGACVPTMTASPNGTLPFAKTVNGRRLTTSERIEAAATAGLVTLVDTSAVFIAQLNEEKTKDCD